MSGLLNFLSQPTTCFLVGGITVWMLLSSRGELWLPQSVVWGKLEAASPGLALAEVCTWIQVGRPVMNFGYGRTQSMELPFVCSRRPLPVCTHRFTPFSAFQLEFVELLEWRERSQSWLIRKGDCRTLTCLGFKIPLVTAAEPLGISVHVAFPIEIKPYVYKITL